MLPGCVMIDFDEATHTYSRNGVVVPSVTQVLTPLTDYSSVPKWRLGQARERGDYVHRMCEMFVWGTLDESDLDKDYTPYLDGFKRFLKDTNFIPEHVEERVYHPQLHYAGTFDLGGSLPPKGRVRKTYRALIDIKTTYAFMPSVGPQTAGYKDAWNKMVDKELRFEKRMALRLKPDEYELIPLRDEGDMNIFQSCLNVYNFMKRKD